MKVLEIISGLEVGDAVDHEATANSRLRLIYFRNGNAIESERLFDGRVSEKTVYCYEKDLKEARKLLGALQEEQIAQQEAVINKHYLEQIRKIRAKKLARI